MAEDLISGDRGRVVRRCVAGLWVLWCVAIVVRYYPKLGQLVADGPSAWLRIDLTDGEMHGLRSFPALGQAMDRAGRGLVGAALVLMAAHAVGTALCAAIRWRGDDWQERLLYRTGAGFLVLSEMSVALAYAHLYRRPIVAALVVLGAAADAWLLALAWRARPRQGALRAFRTTILTRRDIVWKVVSSLAVLIALIGALAPEREFDALWWHLDFPRRWLQTGHLIQPASEYVALYPMSWETIYGSGLAVGGPVAAKLLHFACLPLLSLLVWKTTRRFFPSANPWLAVALLVTAPTVLWEATTAYIDLSGALLIGLAGYALVRYVETRSRPWLIMGGLNIGMAVASKHLSLLALLLLVVLLFVGLHRAGTPKRKAVRPAGAVLGLGMVAAAPWYLHSWASSGNPVFPTAFGLFGAPARWWNVAADEGLQRFMDHFGVTRTPLHLLTLPWSMTVHGAHFGGTFGPLFVMLLPALVLLRRRNPSTGWLVAFAVGYLVLWASPISSFQLRWAIPAVPVLAVLGAEAASRLVALMDGRRLAGVASGALTAAIAVIMVLNLPPLTAYQEADRHGDLDWLTHVVRKPPLPVVLGIESEHDYLSRVVPSSRPWEYLDHRTPANSVVLTMTSGGDQFLTRRSRLPYDAALAQGVAGKAPVGREHEALVALRRLGVSYVLFDRRLLAQADPRSYAIASTRALTCWYDHLYDDGRFLVGRIKWSELLPVVTRGASPWVRCAPVRP